MTTETRKRRNYTEDFKRDAVASTWIYACRNGRHGIQGRPVRVNLWIAQDVSSRITGI